MLSHSIYPLFTPGSSSGSSLYDAIFPKELDVPLPSDGFTQPMEEYFNTAVTAERKRAILALFRRLIPEGETHSWEREGLLKEVAAIPAEDEVQVEQLVKRVMQTTEVRAAWECAATISDLLQIPRECRELAVKKYEQLQTTDPHLFGEIAYSYLPRTRSPSPVLVDDLVEDLEEVQERGWVSIKWGASNTSHHAP